MLSHVRLVPLFRIRPRLELEHLRDHLRVLADGGGTQLCDGRVHRGALVFVDDPHRGLVLRLWPTLERSASRHVPEVNEELRVREDGWVEGDADCLGVPVAIADAVVCGRGGVTAGVSHPGGHHPVELAEDELGFPESPDAEVRDARRLGRGGRWDASRGDADAMRGRAGLAARGRDRRYRLGQR